MSNFGHKGRPGLRGGSAPGTMGARGIDFGAGDMKVRVASPVPLGEHTYAKRVHAAGATDKREHVIVWDQSGTKVFTATGSAESFALEGEFRGMSMVHNHPVGSSFSGGDLGAAKKRALASTSVVTDAFVYTLTPGDGRATFADIPDDTESIWERLFQKLSDSMARRRGGFQWNEDTSHTLMQKVADETGMRYSRRSR